MRCFVESRRTVPWVDGGLNEREAEGVGEEDQDTRLRQRPKDVPTEGKILHVEE